MCGRFQLTKPKQLTLRFKLKNSKLIKEQVPRKNIAPTQRIITIIRSEDGSNEAREMRWGLIPSFSKDEKPKFNMINTRSEGFSEKPYFKRLLNSKRCLVPTTAFYEWRKVGDKKVPHIITMPNEDIFSLAGIFDIWKSPKDEIIESCSIITMAPNAFMKKIHDRMPLILDPKNESMWLESGNEHLEELLVGSHKSKLLMSEIESDYFKINKV